MNRFRDVGIGVLALSLALSVTGLGRAAASQVEKGVQRVFVSGGGVKVSGAVSVDNSPAVTVGNSPTVKIDPSANSVQAIASAPAQVVEQGTVLTVPATAAAVSTSSVVAVVESKDAYAVPAGKRLVIEYVSLDATGLGTADEHLIADLKFGASGTFGPKFYIPLYSQGGVCCAEDGQGYHYVGALQTRLYADAGQTVTLEVTHDYLLDPLTVTFSFSGYLVDA